MDTVHGITGLLADETPQEKPAKKKRRWFMSDEDRSINNPLQTLMTLYGPYAFGLVSLLTVWFSIVAPELAKREVDYKAQAEIIQSLAERDIAQQRIADSMAQTASTMEITAEILRATILRLEGVEEEFDDANK